MLIRSSIAQRGIVSRVEDRAMMCGNGPSNVDFIIPVVKDGGGVTPGTGVLATKYRFNFKLTLLGWTIQADQAGSVQFDIWAATYADGTPLTVANTIMGGGATKPNLTAAQIASGTDLTGWSKQWPANTNFWFNIDSIATITQFSLQLQARRVIN